MGNNFMESPLSMYFRADEGELGLDIPALQKERQKRLLVRIQG